AGGEAIYFSGLTEMTSLNTGYRTLTNKSGDTFQLGDLSAATAAETTGGAVSQQLTAGPATGLDLRNMGKLGGTQVPVFTTTGFDPNAVTRWAIYYIGA
ncbi:MAG: hypothetical protein ABIJ57_07580, partial [Pseudomonadota bacterium]